MSYLDYFGFRFMYKKGAFVFLYKSRLIKKLIFKTRYKLMKKYILYKLHICTACNCNRCDTL